MEEFETKRRKLQHGPECFQARKISSVKSKLFQKFEEAINSEIKNPTFKDYFHFLEMASIRCKGEFCGFMDDNNFREQFPEEFEHFGDGILKILDEASNNHLIRLDYQKALEISKCPSVAVDNLNEIQDLDSCFESPGLCANENEADIQSASPRNHRHSLQNSTSVHLNQSLQDAVNEATQGTAITSALSMKEWEKRRVLFRLLQLAPTNTKNETTNKRNTENNSNALKKLRERLSNPELLHSRAYSFNEVAKDGWSLFHAAAASSNLEALQMLCELRLSSWVRDCQGKTPLHIAAENGCVEACKFLKETMKLEGPSPVGIHAPTDLSGRTPLAWSGQKRSIGLTNTLFLKGDPTVFPLFHAPCLVGKTQRNAGIVHGIYAAQGFRPEMEDAVLCHCLFQDLLPPCVSGIFGVFDGHGGDFAGRFCAKKFVSCFKKFWEQAIELTPESVQMILQKTFLELDFLLESRQEMKVTATKVKGTNKRKFEAEDSSGSTGLVALVASNYVTVASVGDSRAVLYKSNQAGDASCLQMNIEHKPTLPEEQDRIQMAQGQVVTEIIHEASGATEVRVKFDPALENSLGMSRALGDFFYKQQVDSENKRLPPENQIVTAVPTVKCHFRTDDDDFLILACDGVWDVLTNEQVGNLFRFSLSQNLSESSETLSTNKSDQYANGCAFILENAIQAGSPDNMSIIAVDLKSHINQTGSIRNHAASS